LGLTVIPLAEVELKASQIVGALNPFPIEDLKIKFP